MKRKLTAPCQGIRKPNLRRSHNRSIKTKEILEKINPHLSCVGVFVWWIIILMLKA
jgi:hypothetical protein